MTTNPYDRAYSTVDDESECMAGPGCPACEAKAMGLLPGQGRSVEDLEASSARVEVVVGALLVLAAVVLWVVAS